MNDYLFFIIAGVVALLIIGFGTKLNLFLKRDAKQRKKTAAGLKKNLSKRISLKKSIKQIQWNDKFCVDNGAIDKDHRILFGLINRFCMNVPNFTTSRQVMPFLLSLKEYTQKHFKREEALQKASGYAFMEDHQAKHEDLIAQLDAKIKIAENATPDSVSDVAVEIAGFLQGWLVAHVLDEDLSMKPYVERMRERGLGMTSLRISSKSQKRQ